MIPLTHGLILASVLFVLGLTGLVIRRNLLFMLISLEIMINAAALAFVVAGGYWGQTEHFPPPPPPAPPRKRVSAWRCCCSSIVVART